MLTDAQIEQYQRDGYVIPDFRVPEAVLARLDTHIDELLLANPAFRDNCPAVLRHDMSFAHYTQIDGVLDMVSQLIGADLALWNMSLFAKPAGNGKATPWHQDGEYWPIRPLATCTVWIAVDAATAANGCLRVIRGSHRAKKLASHHTNPSEQVTLHQELDADQFDADDAVNIELERGQVSLHDVYLMHGSAANTSKHRRRGLTMRLMPTSSHYSLAVAKELYAARGSNDLGLNPVLLLRGQDQAGENQFTNFVPDLSAVMA